MKNTLPHMIAALIATVSFQANAAIAITEVAPWGSGDAPYEADWFELTNTGNSAIDISGWRVDDSSNAFATALALNGVTNIGAGQSVIFIESAGGAKIPSFIETWFGSNAAPLNAAPLNAAPLNAAPLNAAPLIGYYSGSGIGLSTGGDAVNIFNAAGVRQAFVSFGAADSVSPFQTFDNAAGVNGVISQLSVVGVNGAFVAANDALEIGSPGTIAAVPEPESYAMLLAGLGLMGAASRKRLSK